MPLDPRLTKALFGRYRLERELGSGGMATVYQATDQRHNRSVAIKVLHPEVAASVDSERFLGEIHTTAQLSHPNILPLFDSGSDDGVLYYVMPLVAGESLRARLERENMLDTAEALRITGEVADALGYAHANGVIHRDIKPENILLQSGHALVTDFGIARAPSLTRSDRLTGAGLSVGTPAYMSPEQAAADPHVDGRADQYSLACVLFEMLTGEPPFAGPSVDSILVRRFTRPPPRVASRRPDIARYLDGALFKAMARDPNERFASMERFVEALNAPARPWGALPGTEASVAVLPFANMSGDPENEYFGEGMAEEINNALTKVPGLRVAARTSSFMFKGKSHDLRAIGEELKVNAVLEGSVRRAGNRIRITAQLVSVNDGYHLWSERYDRELTDIFVIQDEIATAIAGRLAAALRGAEAKSLVRASTSNIEAYELYLKARALMKHRGSALLTATEKLERAVALDPEFAPAFAYLAQALVLSGFWGVLSPDQIGERAKSAAASALEHDPNLAAGFTADALVATCIEFNPDRATVAWNRALELDPTDLEARAMRAAFDICYARAAFDEAEKEMRVVIEHDPLSAYAHASLSVILGFAGRFDEALAEAKRARELDPSSFLGVWSEVNAVAFGGNASDMVDEIPQLLSRYGRHPWLMMALSAAFRRAGLTDRADAVYAELNARSRFDYVQPTVLAIAAEWAGRREEALTFLQRAVEIRDPAIVAFQSPHMSSLRTTREFPQILAGLGISRRGSPRSAAADFPAPHSEAVSQR